MIHLRYGMLPGGNLADALQRVLRLCGNDWLAVVRSIDSSRPPEHLVKVLAFHRVPHDVISGNFCLTIDTLRKALDGAWRGRLFVHFDEVWIIAGMPSDFDLASLPYATSEQCDFSSGVPDSLANAMEKMNCVLIPGDGCGLNYATTEPRIAGLIAGEAAH